MSELAGQLPAGWVEKYSEQHQRRYWKNTDTGEKSWTRPPLNSSKGNKDDHNKNDRVKTDEGGDYNDGDWEERFSDEHGKAYFYNKKTKRKSWTRQTSNPEAIVNKEQSAKELPRTKSTGSLKNNIADINDEGEWEQKFSDKHGKSYYVNKKSKRKSWICPGKEFSDDLAKKNDTEIEKEMTDKKLSEKVNLKLGNLSPVDEAANDANKNDEWEEKFSEKHGKPYYVNKKTKRKSWVRVKSGDAAVSKTEEEFDDNSPVDHLKSLPRTGSAGSMSGDQGLGNDGVDDWEEKFSDKHGKSYFVNKKTKRKSWIFPSKDLSEDSAMKKNAEMGAKVESDKDHYSPHSVNISPVDEIPNDVNNGDEWEEKFSEKHGKPYYVNKKTKRKSWVRVKSGDAAVSKTEEEFDDNSPVDHLKSLPRTGSAGSMSGDQGLGNDGVDDWEEKFSDKHGKTYFVNKKTKRKSWVCPTTIANGDTDKFIDGNKGLVATSKDKVVSQLVRTEIATIFEGVSGDWEEKFSEKHGKPYYFNKKTKRKSWVIPDSVNMSCAANTNSEDRKMDSVDSLACDENGVGLEMQNDSNTGVNKDHFPSDGGNGFVDAMREDEVKDKDVVILTKEVKNFNIIGELVLCGENSSKDPCDKVESSTNDSHPPDHNGSAVRGKATAVDQCNDKKVWFASALDEQSETSCDLKKESLELSELEMEKMGTIRQIENLENFVSDISVIEKKETPQSSPVKDSNDDQALPLTVESIRKYTESEIVATLNYYMKTNSILEHNLSIMDEKYADARGQNDAFVTDNDLLRNTIHDYASQHHVREEMIQNLQAKVSLLERERDEAQHTLQDEQTLHADKDVNGLILEETVSELKSLNISLETELSRLKSEVEVLRIEKEDLAAKNNSLNTLCGKDSHLISSLEHELLLRKRTINEQQEKLLLMKAKYTSVTKKCDKIESELTKLKSSQCEIMVKNRQLINDNSKLIKRVNNLQQKNIDIRGESTCPEKKKAPLRSVRFSSEGIHIPVNMIQSPTSRYCESVLDYSLSDISGMEDDCDKVFKRRPELEAGWVFIDMDVANHPIQLDNQENSTTLVNF